MMDTSNNSGAKYRNLLIETINKLEDFNSIMYDSVLNLSMQGELKEVDDLFENGEIVNFKLADFRELSDQNVRQLIELMDSINKKNQTLKNINAISDDDLLPF